MCRLSPQPYCPHLTGTFSYSQDDLNIIELESTMRLHFDRQSFLTIPALLTKQGYYSTTIRKIKEVPGPQFIISFLVRNWIRRDATQLGHAREMVAILSLFLAPLSVG